MNLTVVTIAGPFTVISAGPLTVISE